MRSAASIIREMELVRSSSLSDSVKAKLVAQLEREVNAIAAVLPEAAISTPEASVPPLKPQK